MEPITSSSPVQQANDGLPPNDDHVATRLEHFLILAPFFVCFDAFLMALDKRQYQSSKLCSNMYDHKHCAVHILRAHFFGAARSCNLPKKIRDVYKAILDRLICV